MDTQDVSQNSQIMEALQRAEMIQQIAKLRKGQLVHDHPPPDSVVANSYAAAETRNMAYSSTNHHVVTTQLPPSYLPSSSLLEELQPITIRQMRLEEHHRGAKVTLRVLSPPARINAITGAVEDLDGTAVILQLYHQAPEKTVPATEVLQLGSVCILKEPYFKRATDGSYSLRVDHLSDMVWLEPSDVRIPDTWKIPVPTMSSKTWREQGNNAVSKKHWAEALRLYSNACRNAVTLEEEQLAFVNRSYANLNLGRPEQALRDAIETNERTLPTEKSQFREIRALYELHAFDRCVERLEQFTATYPDNNAAKKELKSVKTRLEEQTNGTYSFALMYKQAAATSCLVDCATFSSPVEVREAPGRGRGLFTVKSVQAGDLLLCEKAFAYNYSDTTSDNYSILMDLDTKRAFAGGQAIILTQIIQNLFHSPETSRPFLQLYHGDYKTVSRDRADGNPIVDSFLAAHIMSLNVFGAPRSSRDSLSKHLKNEEDSTSDKRGFGTAGIWIQASYVNHSCLGNCRRSFIGDMQIVRATMDMKQGTELRFPYHPSKELESYDDVQRGLKNWGFSCDCAFCQARRATPAEVVRKRKSLFMTLKGVLETHNTKLAKASKLLDDIKATYSASYPDELPRLELYSPCFAISVQFYRKGNFIKAAEMLLEGLRALSYKIAVVWPHDKAADGEPKAQFEIKRWGMALDMVPWAFVNLHGIATTLAPGLCPRTLEYAETAYSMVVGENWSFKQTFPTAK